MYRPVPRPTALRFVSSRGFFFGITLRVGPVPGHLSYPGPRPQNSPCGMWWGFFEKTLTKFGSGARIGCPKQCLGRGAHEVIRGPRARVSDRTARRPDRAEGSPQYLVPEPPKAKD